MELERQSQAGNEEGIMTYEDYVLKNRSRSQTIQQNETSDIEGHDLLLPVSFERKVP